MTETTGEHLPEVTSAARRTMDKYLAGVAEEVLLKARSYARASGYGSTVAVQDMVRAIESQQVSRSSERTDGPRARRIRVLSSVALAYITIGLLAATISLVTITRTILIYIGAYTPGNGMNWPLLLLTSGLLLTTVGVTVYIFVNRPRRGPDSLIPTSSNRSRDKEVLRGTSLEPSELGFLLVRLWTDFEVSLRSVLSDKVGDSSGGLNLRKLLSRGNAIGLYDSETEEALVRVLQTRNAVVHGSDQLPGVEDLLKQLDLLERMRARLSRYRFNAQHASE